MPWDGRIAAGAELYGTLKEEHVSRLEGEEALERESGNLVDFLEKSDNEDVWYAAVSPQSYLNYVTKPFYTCIGTNSSSSAPDATMEMLFRMNNDNEGIAVFAAETHGRRAVFLPRQSRALVQKHF